MTIPPVYDQRGSKVTSLPPPPYFGQRSWSKNIIKRIQVLTGGVHMAKITMDSGTYEILIWQGWWSPARWWRRRDHENGE